MIIETKYEHGDIVRYKTVASVAHKKVCPECNGRSPEELRIDCKCCDNYGWIRENVDEEIETVGEIKQIILDEFRDLDGEKVVMYWIKALKDMYTDFGAIQIPHIVREEQIIGKEEV